jgi:polysaccharide export outer membrane protein
LVLGGCIARTDFPVGAERQAKEVPPGVNIIQLTPGSVGAYAASSGKHHAKTTLSSSTRNWQYLVGVGDVLSITVWDHPELTLPAGPERSQIESGSSVNANGEIFYPFLNQVRVAGKPVGMIQKELTQKLSVFIPKPQIEVKVAAFNSQRVVVTGAVKSPGSQIISNIPRTLIEAINGAGGLTEQADSHHVTVRRAGRTHSVHLKAFLSDGAAGNNPVLRGGDIVNVPTRENNVAYVLGQVNQPGAVDLGLEGLNLTDAIAQRGGLVESLANAKGIFVFRKGGKAAIDVFQLDARSALAFVVATKFALHPQDVVYVVTDPAGRWNAVIAKLLPSITATRGLQVIGNDL